MDSRCSFKTEPTQTPHRAAHGEQAQDLTTTHSAEDADTGPRPQTSQETVTGGQDCRSQAATQLEAEEVDAQPRTPQRSEPENKAPSKELVQQARPKQSTVAREAGPAGEVPQQPQTQQRTITGEVAPPEKLAQGRPRSEQGNALGETAPAEKSPHELREYQDTSTGETAPAEDLAQQLCAQRGTVTEEAAPAAGSERRSHSQQGPAIGGTALAEDLARQPHAQKRAVQETTTPSDEWAPSPRAERGSVADDPAPADARDPQVHTPQRASTEEMALADTSHHGPPTSRVNVKEESDQADTTPERSRTPYPPVKKEFEQEVEGMLHRIRVLLRSDEEEAQSPPAHAHPHAVAANSTPWPRTQHLTNIGRTPPADNGTPKLCLVRRLLGAELAPHRRTGQPRRARAAAERAAAEREGASSPEVQFLACPPRYHVGPGGLTVPERKKAGFFLTQPLRRQRAVASTKKTPRTLRYHDDDDSEDYEPSGQEDDTDELNDDYGEISDFDPTDEFMIEDVFIRHTVVQSSNESALAKIDNPTFPWTSEEIATGDSTTSGEFKVRVKVKVESPGARARHARVVDPSSHTLTAERVAALHPRSNPRAAALAADRRMHAIECARNEGAEAALLHTQRDAVEDMAPPPRAEHLNVASQQVTPPALPQCTPAAESPSVVAATAAAPAPAAQSPRRVPLVTAVEAGSAAQSPRLETVAAAGAASPAQSPRPVVAATAAAGLAEPSPDRVPPATAEAGSATQSPRRGTAEAAVPAPAVQSPHRDPQAMAEAGSAAQSPRLETAAAVEAASTAQSPRLVAAATAVGELAEQSPHRVPPATAAAGSAAQSPCRGEAEATVKSSTAQSPLPVAAGTAVVELAEPSPDRVPPAAAEARSAAWSPRRGEAEATVASSTAQSPHPVAAGTAAMELAEPSPDPVPPATAEAGLAARSPHRGAAEATVVSSTAQCPLPVAAGTAVVELAEPSPDRVPSATAEAAPAAWSPCRGAAEAAAFSPAAQSPFPVAEGAAADAIGAQARKTNGSAEASLTSVEDHRASELASSAQATTRAQRTSSENSASPDGPKSARRRPRPVGIPLDNYASRNRDSQGDLFGIHLSSEDENFDDPVTINYSCSSELDATIDRTSSESSADERVGVRAYGLSELTQGANYLRMAAECSRHSTHQHAAMGEDIIGDRTNELSEVTQVADYLRTIAGQSRSARHEQSVTRQDDQGSETKMDSHPALDVPQENEEDDDAINVSGLVSHTSEINSAAALHYRNALQVQNAGANLGITRLDTRPSAREQGEVPAEANARQAKEKGKAGDVIQASDSAEKAPQKSSKRDRPRTTRVDTRSASCERYDEQPAEANVTQEKEKMEVRDDVVHAKKTVKKTSKTFISSEVPCNTRVDTQPTEGEQAELLAETNVGQTKEQRETGDDVIHASESVLKSPQDSTSHGMPPSVRVDMRPAEHHGGCETPSSANARQARGKREGGDDVAYASEPVPKAPRNPATRERQLTTKADTPSASRERGELPAGANVTQARGKREVGDDVIHESEPFQKIRRKSTLHQRAECTPVDTQLEAHGRGELPVETNVKQAKRKREVRDDVIHASEPIQKTSHKSTPEEKPVSTRAHTWLAAGARLPASAKVKQAKGKRKADDDVLQVSELGEKTPRKVTPCDILRTTLALTHCAARARGNISLSQNVTQATEKIIRDANVIHTSEAHQGASQASNIRESLARTQSAIQAQSQLLAAVKTTSPASFMGKCTDGNEQHSTVEGEGEPCSVVTPSLPAGQDGNRWSLPASLIAYEDLLRQTRPSVRSHEPPGGAASADAGTAPMSMSTHERRANNAEHFTMELAMNENGIMDNDDYNSISSTGISLDSAWDLQTELEKHGNFPPHITTLPQQTRALRLELEGELAQLRAQLGIVPKGTRNTNNALDGQARNKAKAPATNVTRKSVGAARPSDVSKIYLRNNTSRKSQGNAVTGQSSKASLKMADGEGSSTWKAGALRKGERKGSARKGLGHGVNKMHRKNANKDQARTGGRSNKKQAGESDGNTKTGTPRPDGSTGPRGDAGEVVIQPKRRRGSGVKFSYSNQFVAPRFLQKAVVERMARRVGIGRIRTQAFDDLFGHADMFMTSFIENMNLLLYATNRSSVTSDEVAYLLEEVHQFRTSI